MPKINNLTGNQYGRLTVISKGKNKGIITQWLCSCSCGVTKSIATQSLVRGLTRSCGCLRSESTAKRKMKHGGAYSKEYSSWTAMRKRCLYEKDIAFSSYGGRGIKVCDRWANSFENFLLDMGLAPSKNHSIDRKNTNLDYSPENCKWSTPLEQSNNRRNTLTLNIGGVTKPLIMWCREFGVNYSRAFYQFKRGTDPKFYLTHGK